MFRYFMSVFLSSNLFAVHFSFVPFQCTFCYCWNLNKVWTNVFDLVIFFLQLSLSASNLLDRDITSKVYYNLFKGANVTQRFEMVFYFSMFLAYFNILNAFYARESNRIIRIYYFSFILDAFSFGLLII